MRKILIAISLLVFTLQGLSYASFPVHIDSNVKQTIVPVDTAAVLKQLQFRKLSYDTLFTRAAVSAPDRPASALHIRKRDVVLPIAILLMLIYVTWLRFVYAKELRENITVILNPQLGHQIYRDREFSANIFKLLTFLNFAFVGGVFLFLLGVHFRVIMPFHQTIFNILICAGAIILLYLLKGMLYALIGWVFRTGPALSFFRFNALVIYHLVGLAILPLVILAAFAQSPVNTWALFGALFMLGIALLVRAAKGLSVLRMLERFHIVYFFLYICALEIAPILIAVKLFSMWG